MGNPLFTLPAPLTGEILAHLAEGVRLGDPIAQGRLRHMLMGPLLDALMRHSTEVSAIAAEAATVDALEAWFDACEARGTLDPSTLADDVMHLALERLGKHSSPPWPSRRQLHPQLRSGLDPTDRLAFDAVHDAQGNRQGIADRLGHDLETMAGPLERMRQAILWQAAESSPPLARALNLDPQRDARLVPVLRAFIEGDALSGAAAKIASRELVEALAEPEERLRYEAVVHLERTLEGCEGASTSQKSRLLAHLVHGPAEEGASKAPLILGVGFALIGLMSVFLFLGPSDPVGAALPTMSVLRAGVGEMAHLDDARANAPEGQEVGAGETLAPGEGLYFAYGNPPESPFRHWMIVGRDARSQLHWYHPAPGAPAPQGPTGASTFMLKDIRWRPLKRVIYAKHPPGNLRICGLFFEDKGTLLEAREHLERTGDWPESGHRDCRTITVMGEGP
ncbi:MAG: hypothetical protein ACE366_12030 [Bradymonadia bacterium]